MGLDVLYQSSAAFVIPTAVSIYSLCVNNKQMTDLQVHVIEDGISDIDRAHLSEVAGRFNRPLSFIAGREMAANLRKDGLEPYHGSYTCFLKLFAPDIVSCERLLYLDSDTLVVGDLSPLASFDLGAAPCAVALELDAAAYRDFYGRDRRFFNTGVMLLNRAVWDKHNIGERLREAARGLGRNLLVADRDLIEIVIGDAIATLPAQYNVTTLMHLFGQERFLERHGYRSHAMAYYSRAELASAQASPKIVHYLDAYTKMPWDRVNTNPFTSLYLTYAQECGVWKRMKSIRRKSWLGLLKDTVVAMTWPMPKPARSWLVYKVMDNGTKYQLWRRGLRNTM